MLANWVGRYRLLFSEALRRWTRERLEQHLADPNQRLAALEEAEAEARLAEIEISADGRIASRAGGPDFYRVPLHVAGSQATFVKRPNTAIALSLAGDIITAVEAGKPEMRFERVTPP